MTTLADDPDPPENLPPSDDSGTTNLKPLGSGYFLDYPIGRGSSGRVWRARRRGDGSPVAIKVLHDQFAADPDVVTRFLRESTTLQGLSHPHLVRVDDLVAEGETVAVVMEFIDGEDLRQIAQRGGLDYDGALTVLAQVARALAYIHTEGVLHRDIKPENVLVTERRGKPFAQLTDFGLAWVTGSRQLTSGWEVVGTPAYLAPELLASRPYGAPVDIYALGVTAHEMLVGRRPFEGDHPLALMRAHLDDQPKRPAGMARDVWRVVRRCLAKRPQDRPTAEQLAILLENLRRTTGVLRPARASSPSPASSAANVSSAVSSARRHYTSPAAGGGPRLAIDFGTANTTAVLRWPGGRVEPLIFDGSPLLPSAAYVKPDGDILTGREALDAARLQPHRCDPYPKLDLATGSVLLGDREIDTVEVITAVLRRVAAEARRIAATVPARVSLTHPPDWDPRSLAVLDQAARAAGLPQPAFVNEPVATACYLANCTDVRLEADAVALVYDLGAAKLTVSVLRADVHGGFDVLAHNWLPDVGGIDIDSAVLTHLGQLLSARAPADWRRLSRPKTAEDRRHAWRLWEDVRQAKESLAEDPTTYLHLPFGHCMALDDQRLHELARPILVRTIEATRIALESAGIPAAAVTATFLSGGSSRIPLVSSLLRREFGTVPRLLPQPELVMAYGAACSTPPGSVASTHSALPSPAPDHLPEPARHRPVHGRLSDRVMTSPARPPMVGHLTRQMMTYAGPTTTVLLIGAVALASLLLPLPGDRTSQAAGFPQARDCGRKIAFLGPLGDAFAMGMRDSAKLAVEKYNAGHVGCTVKLIEYDTFNPVNSSHDLAGTRAREILADTKILGVVGPIRRDELDTTLPLLQSAGVPVISPSIPDNDVSHRGWKVFHRTVGSDRADAAAGVRLLTRVLKKARAFVVDDNSRVGMEAATEAKLRLGPDLVGSGSINGASTDHSPILDKIQAVGADLVYYTGFPVAGGALVRQLRGAMPTITVVGTDRLFSTDFLTAGTNAAVNGVHVISPLMPPDRAGRGFADQFKARFKMEAPLFGPETFDAATILLSGLGAGKATRGEMLAWVHSYDGNGVSRHIKFDSRGDLDAAQEWAYRIVGGRFVADSVIAER